MGRRLRIHLPGPHPKQQEIEQCKAKRIVAVTGRRFGKTTSASRKGIHRANLGRQILYISPVFAQTDTFWEYCVTWLWDAIKIGMVKKNETSRSLKFLHSGGRIIAKTGSRPDHVRGIYADELLLDEYAYQNPEIWEKVDD